MLGAAVLARRRYLQTPYERRKTVPPDISNGTHGIHELTWALRHLRAESGATLRRACKAVKS
ncbi:hypothetical protein GCM10010129_44130 [Streptomyces fumigatiscleroticus]|nr:hypothetical protein GCM10010129_44130 [Streptomyces fumigatiscleroticus]